MKNTTQLVEALQLQYNKMVVQEAWEEALAIIEQIIDLHPTANFYYKRGAVLLKLSRYKEGIANLQEALQLDPEHRKSLAMLKKFGLKPKTDSVVEPLVTQRRNFSPLEEQQSQKTPPYAEQDSETPPSFVASPKAADSHIEKIEPTRPLTQICAGEHFGRYELISEIGEGGMGKVYQAHDPKLDRMVAIKVLVADIAYEKLAERFLREAKAMARLRHPHIVTVYDMGSYQGHSYFTMDFIDGQSLKDWLQQAKPSLTQIVEIIATIAIAIHYAHEQGIIHRDIKPANVMIDSQGTPKVMDFGLAKILYSEDNISQTGERMGTPVYMSPEQVNAEKVDTRSDVYALGATLYVALTGQTPFQGETYFNTVYKIMNVPPLPPKKLNGAIPKSLERICLKCLEKEPAKRYDSAKILAQDLQQFLQLQAGMPSKISLRDIVYQVVPVMLPMVLVAWLFTIVLWQQSEQALVDFQVQTDKKLNNLQQRNEELSVRLADMYCDRARTDNVDSALQDYTTAIQLAPQSAKAYFKRGVLHYRRKNYQLAIADFAKAKRLAPNHKKIQAYLRVSHKRLQQQSN